MAPRTDTFDLAGLRLSSGEGRKLDLMVSIEPFEFAGERYPVEPALVPVRLDISCTVGGGYVLRLRFDATLTGPCMRCLEPATPATSVDAREVSQPEPDDSRAAHFSEAGGRAGGRREGEELSSPYVDGSLLDLHSWARDALALALPAQVLCREDCAGLCPECGVDLNTAGPDHRHEAAPDPRWERLSEIKFE
jgi:uncharacterized protein